MSNVVGVQVRGLSDADLRSGVGASTGHGPGGAPWLASLSPAQRLSESARRALAYMPGESAARLGSLLTPEALAAVTGTLVVWAGSHAVGIGEAVDVLLLGVGVVFLGREAVDALQDVAAYVRLSVDAREERDLDEAGRRLAHAVALIGVDVVLAFVVHGGVKTWRARYRPSVSTTTQASAGSGWTNKYGDITYSSLGTDIDRALVLYHEKVHAFLSPRILPLRQFRADVRMAGYQRSALLRYVEEALAESYAQLRVNGVKGLPTGIRFPIANGYVTLRAVAIEAAGVTIVAGGIVYAVDLSLDSP